MYVQYCDTVRRNYVGYSQLAQINNLPALFVVIMLKRKPFIWKLVHCLLSVTWELPIPSICAKVQSWYYYCINGLFCCIISRNPLSVQYYVGRTLPSQSRHYKARCISCVRKEVC